MCLLYTKRTLKWKVSNEKLPGGAYFYSFGGIFILYLVSNRYPRNLNALQGHFAPLLTRGFIMLYRVIAKRTSYEYINIEADSKEDAIGLVTMSDQEFDWDDLPELEWDIDTVEEA